MKKLLLLAGLALGVGCLGGCMASSTSYTDQQAGYSVIRGRITSVENMCGDELDRLSDGVAITISEPGCRVTITFADKRTAMMELGPGVIVVYGATEDYILQSAPGMPVE